MIDNTLRTYTLSWYEHTEIPYLQKRRWWNIFGSDTMEHRKEWVHKKEVVSDPELVNLFLRKTDDIINAQWVKLLFRDKTIYDLQLEEGGTLGTFVRKNAGSGVDYANTLD